MEPSTEQEHNNETGSMLSASYPEASDGHSTPTANIEPLHAQSESSDSKTKPSPSMSDSNHTNHSGLDENLATFFNSWIHDVIHIFAPTGASLHSRAFWASQMRNDYDHLLWRPSHWGHGLTDNERDCLMDLTLTTMWPRVQKIVDGRERVLRRAAACLEGHESKKMGPRGGKLRRAMAREERFERMDLDGEDLSGEEVEDDLTDWSGWDVTYGSSLQRELSKAEGMERGRSEWRTSVCEPGGERVDSEEKMVDLVAMARPAKANVLLKKGLRGL